MMGIYLLLFIIWLSNSLYARPQDGYDENKAAIKRAKIASRLVRQGFGRVMTWNVEHLGVCLQETDVQQLREATCIVLQSANLIALQNAEKLDLSCLPCNTELKDDYEWPGEGSSEELKIMVKTKRTRSFSVKKLEVCNDAMRAEANKRETISSPYSNITLDQTVRKTLHAAVQNEQTGSKRAMYTVKRGDSTLTKKDINYALLTIQSDLNVANTFVMANVKLPKKKSDRRMCMQSLLSDISNVVSTIPDAKVLILGDLHIDVLEGSDDTGRLTKIITNMQVNGDSFRPVITFNLRDPLTTVSGRRFDNIITNGDLKGEKKMIGPELPLSPDSHKIPLTLQRLYNNFMVAQYTMEGNQSSNIYDCMKAYQLAGKGQLDNTICKDTWVPSGYLSDHLPLAITIKMDVKGKSSPVTIKLASWNIDGENTKARLGDPVIRKTFLKYLKKYHAVIFHEFPPYDEIVNKDELESSDIIRMRQGSLETEFGIYLNVDAKDGDPEMFVLRRSDDESEVSNPSPNEVRGFLTKVGLFVTKMTVDSEKIRACIYQLTLDSKDINIEQGMKRMIPVIQKDMKQREECQFKLLLASLHAEPTFDLDAAVYRQFKIIKLPCAMTDDQNYHRYVKKGVSMLHDYVIVLDTDSNVTADDCVIDLPGAERDRGFEQITDWKELSAHYPLSVISGKSL